MFSKNLQQLDYHQKLIDEISVKYSHFEFKKKTMLVMDHAPIYKIDFILLKIWN